jgi:ribose transport system substrate-binding protein
MSKALLVWMVLLLLALPGCDSSPPTLEPAREVIAVVPKGTSHLFWRTIEAGAREAAADYGVEIIWKGPLKENDRAQQIALVEQLVTQGVSGIVLAPLDDVALLRPVKAAGAKGIPVLVFDTGLKGEPGQDFISFVATDNFAAGRLAGERMAEILGGSGKVGVLRYQVGSDSTTQREEGFLDHVRNSSSLEILLDSQYGGVTVGEIIEKSEGMLDVVRQLDGVFCPTEPTTSGLIIALRKHGLAGQLKVIGFDSSDELLEGVRNEEIDSLVLQEPRKMAYLAVETMVKHLRGEKVQERIDTGARLITIQNLDGSAVEAATGGD